MTNQCPYCGKPVKKSDRFCIACGKPLISESPKEEKKLDVKKTEEKEDKKKKKKEKKEKKEKAEEEEEKEEGEEEEEEEEEIIEVEAKPLPEDVKEQIETHLELKEIQEKKKTLLDKLTESQKLLKSPQYEVDYEFGEKVKVQVEAVKILIQEVKKNENELKQNIEGKFIVDKINTDIAVKRDQLKNLMREHRLKKIRDKDVVRKLREKYKQQLKEFTTQKAELVAGLNLWIEDLIEKKSELTTEKNFNKARFSSKEIAEDEYKRNDVEYVKELDKVTKRLKSLKILTK